MQVKRITEYGQMFMKIERLRLKTNVLVKEKRYTQSKRGGGREGEG